jgi:uncharacterized membrane-anchored protein
MGGQPSFSEGRSNCLCFNPPVLIMHFFHRLTVVTSLSFAALLCTGSFSQAAAEKTPAPAVEEEKPNEMAGVKLTYGPATVKLGTVAELKLPEGYAFVGPDSLDRFFELRQNFRSNKEVGVVLSREHGWMIFEYEAVGYVKDDDKKDLDPDKLYKRMEENQETSNKQRKSRGWDELRLEGWARKPYYDEKTNHLRWAIRASSSEDQHKTIFANGNMRMLGRGGVMTITLVASAANFDQASIQTDALLTGFSYVQGQKYAEFRDGDKVAKYGLAALVLGGAGFAAAKMGLLAKFGVLLAKMGKLVVLAVAAIGAAIVRFFKKITGRA